MQHLDPEHESLLPEILARATAIPVSQAEGPGGSAIDLPGPSRPSGVTRSRRHSWLRSASDPTRTYMAGGARLPQATTVSAFADDALTVTK